MKMFDKFKSSIKSATDSAKNLGGKAKDSVKSATKKATDGTKSIGKKVSGLNPFKK